MPAPTINTDPIRFRRICCRRPRCRRATWCRSPAKARCSAPLPEAGVDIRGVQPGWPQPGTCDYTPAGTLATNMSATYDASSGEIIGPDGTKYTVKNSTTTGDDGMEGRCWLRSADPQLPPLTADETVQPGPDVSDHVDAPGSRLRLLTGVGRSPSSAAWQSPRCFSSPPELSVIGHRRRRRGCPRR